MTLQYDPENGWHMRSVRGTIAEKFQDLETAYDAYVSWLGARESDQEMARAQ